MQIAVTGGAGFIGSHLARMLMRRGNKVVILDNVSSYYDISHKLRNLRQLSDEARNNFVFEKVDVTDKQDLRGVFRRYSFDVIIHLAAQPGVRYSLKHPGEVARVNIVGTISIMEIAKEFKIRKILAASSSSVYGEKYGLSEDDPCVEPLSPYAASKRSSELIASTFARLYDLQVVFIRFFTVYGPGGRPDMAAYRFIEKIHQNETIDKYGDGTQSREFTYIDDIVDGVYNILQYLLDQTETYFDIVNLGGGQTESLNNFISIVEKCLNKTATVRIHEALKCDPKKTQSNSKKSRQVYHFSPKVELEEGIRRTVDWYLASIQGQKSENHR